MSTPSKSTTKRSEPWRSNGGGAPLSVAMACSDPEAFLRVLLLERSSSGLVQFFRYGLVGGVAFVCDFSTLRFATDHLGIHYLLSAALGFAVGLIVNYLLSVRWVFDKSKITRSSVQFGVFALVGIVGLVLNELVMWSLTDGVGINYMLSKLAATVLVYLWNFTARKVLIF
jgi:putative flippase GtrA